MVSIQRFCENPRVEGGGVDRPSMRRVRDGGPDPGHGRPPRPRPCGHRHRFRNPCRSRSKITWRTDTIQRAGVELLEVECH